MAVLVFAAFGAVRYLQTERGEVFLLDLGFDGRLERVQEEIGGRIINALIQSGVRRERIVLERKIEPSGPVAVLKAVTPAGISLLQVNSAVDEAVRSAGGRVRSCHESEGGGAIEMEIGTRRNVTHRCVIRKGGKEAGKVPGAEKGPALAVVVDDFGYFDNSLVRRFLEIGVPLTITVIPGLEHSKEICRKALDAGKEVLCHLPMEPEEGAEKAGGDHLVLVGMSDEEIEGSVESALATTPDVVGINNHMGSLATADRRVMEAVMRVCRRRGLFFMDSMTTPRSVAGEAAEKVGVPSFGNDSFIDNRDGDTEESVRRLISIAKSRGLAAGIMHVRKKAFGDLQWLIGEARREGVRLVTASEMLELRGVSGRKGG